MAPKPSLSGKLPKFTELRRGQVKRDTRIRGVRNHSWNVEYHIDCPAA